MPITFKCEHCQTELTVKDELAGMQGKCPSCKEVLVVPRASSNGVQPAPVAKKRPVEDEDEVPIESVEDEEDDRPRKKAGKSRKAASYDDDEYEYEDEDDRPRKAKKKSSRRDDDDDEDEDDRPAKRKATARRRRDDDDEWEDEDDPKVAKRNKARRRLAAVGVLLHLIGSFVYAGACVLAVLGMFILAGSISSLMSKEEQARKAFEKGERPKISEAEARKLQKDAEEAAKKARSLGEWADLDKIKTPSESERRTSSGVMVWAIASGGATTAIGFLVGLALFAGLGLSVAGFALMLRTPGSTPLFAFSIAGLSCTGLSALCYLFVFIILLTGDGGLCTLLPFCMLNPFSGFVRAAVMNDLATWIVSRIGFLLYLIPLLELGRLTTFALYQWFVGKVQRVRSARSSGFLMMILVPSVIVGMGLLVFLISSAMPTHDKMILTSKDRPGPWGAAMVLVLGALTLAGLFVWHALTQFKTRNALKYGD
jgi:hypothetical protein